MKDLKPLLLALMALPMVGCIYRPRSWDSYHSTFQANPPEPNKADPYTFGGIAEGSGGTLTRTSYATDSKSPDPRSATESGRAAISLDQPRVEGPVNDPTITIHGDRGQERGTSSTGLQMQIDPRTGETNLVPSDHGPHGATNQPGPAAGGPAPAQPNHKPDINAQKGSPLNAPPMRG
jgi:hypothetical protein